MSNQSTQKVLVIGAGLAGSELSLFLARHGINVVLMECKTLQLGPAQKIPQFAELVCTNSLKSMVPTTPHGLLKFEMEKLGSAILEIGRKNAVPAGDALAVDREKFSQELTMILRNHPLIEIVEFQATDPLAHLKEWNCDLAVLATGPLTTPDLEKWIQHNIADDDFYFYDAIAPIVDADSLDFEKMYFKDRYKDIEKDTQADYLNVPLNEDQYYSFVEQLVSAEKVPAKDFEELKFFESCLPIDTMAERGKETLRFSCMKPVGLEHGEGKRPYAVVQLRKENLLGSAFNLVGFQNRLTYKEQLRIFRQLPGFENANFIHLGSVHRNSFLHTAKLLNNDLSSKKYPQLFFAGQIVGVEGYTESASMGLYVGHQIIQRLKGIPPLTWPVETAIGALIHYVLTAPKPIPSNINFGLIPTIELDSDSRRSKDRKKVKKEKVVARAHEIFEEFIGGAGL